MSVLVQTLIDQTRLLSNLKNNQFYTDDDIGGFLSDAGRELADIFIASYEHYFQRNFDFTLAGGVGANAATLPTDFQKANILLRNPALPNPDRVLMLANLLERNAANVWGPGFGRRYFIADDQIELLPAASAAGDYRLVYTPQFADVWPSPATVSVRLATDAALAATPAGTGVGKTLTLVGTSPLLVDGTATAVADRILVKDMGDVSLPASNGIYVLIQQGNGSVSAILRRAPDYDTNAEIAAVTSIRVTAGATNINKLFVQTATPVSIDVLPLTFAGPTLRASLVPWQMFLKAHASRTILFGRKQPLGEVGTILAEQHARAAKMAANKTEDVTQAPMQRRSRAWWGGGGGSNW